jgi:hypothetical protein
MSQSWAQITCDWTIANNRKEQFKNKEIQINRHIRAYEKYKSICDSRKKDIEIYNELNNKNLLPTQKNGKTVQIFTVDMIISLVFTLTFDRIKKNNIPTHILNIIRSFIDLNDCDGHPSTFVPSHSEISKSYFIGQSFHGFKFGIWKLFTTCNYAQSNDKCGHNEDDGDDCRKVVIYVPIYDPYIPLYCNTKIHTSLKNISVIQNYRYGQWCILYKNIKWIDNIIRYKQCISTGVLFFTNTLHHYYKNRHFNNYKQSDKYDMIDKLYYM